MNNFVPNRVMESIKKSMTSSGSSQDSFDRTATGSSRNYLKRDHNEEYPGAILTKRRYDSEFSETEPVAAELTSRKFSIQKDFDDQDQEENIPFGDDLDDEKQNSNMSIDAGHSPNGRPNFGLPNEYPSKENFFYNCFTGREAVDFPTELTTLKTIKGIRANPIDKVATFLRQHVLFENAEKGILSTKDSSISFESSVFEESDPDVQVISYINEISNLHFDQYLNFNDLTSISIENSGSDNGFQQFVPSSQGNRRNVLLQITDGKLNHSSKTSKKTFTNLQFMPSERIVITPVSTDPNVVNTIKGCKYYTIFKLIVAKSAKFYLPDGTLMNKIPMGISFDIKMAYTSLGLVQRGKTLKEFDDRLFPSMKIYFAIVEESKDPIRN